MTSWPLSIINKLTVLLTGIEQLRAYSFKRIKDNLSTELDSSYSFDDCCDYSKEVFSTHGQKNTIFNILPAVNLV